MQADETMTKQESEEMIKQLEKVFDIVRLLDEETLYGGSGIESEGGEVCQCYSFWGRNGTGICSILCQCVSPAEYPEDRARGRSDCGQSSLFPFGDTRI